MKRSNQYPIALFWLAVSLSLVLLTGCVAGDPAAPAAAAATPIPTCAPPTKFYTATSGVLGNQSQNAAIMANQIYTQYTSAPSNLAISKSQAMNFLAYETMRWSHVEDIQVDANNSVRVIVTFISPELVRAVMLNHFLFNPYAGQAQNLNDLTNTILGTLDTQNEYFFLIVMQPVTANQNNKNISIVPNKITLSNGSDIQASTANTDSFLNRPFSFSSKPLAGLIFFPIARNNGTACNSVLDPLHDTSITLNIQSAQIGDQNNTIPINWDIPFMPALSVVSAVPTPNPSAAIAANEGQPLEEWPQSAFPLVDVNWKTLGRLVWGKLTLDYFSLR